MPKFSIQGPSQLQGEITVAGAKNHALAMIPAALLADGESILSRVPDIRDVKVLLNIVENLGAKVHHEAGQARIDARALSSSTIVPTQSGQARASIMLIGPLLHRFGKATIGHPGGCAIGRRPIDQFLAGFQALGAEVQDTGEAYEFTAKQLKGATYFFPFVSVTATEALMIAAAGIPETTLLKNAAAEPEVIALAEFLKQLGAQIEGAGTHTICITGSRQLQSSSAAMIPDRLEAGMFAILAASTQSRVLIKECNPEHLESLLKIFELMGVNYKRGADWLEILAGGVWRAPGKVVTHEYPGFATDLQPPLTVLLTQAQGATLVHETIFEGRLFYVDLLNRMGANILLCDPHRALVQGPTPLRGKRIESPDIRAGIAMVIAALIAEGETVIDNIYQIERGFENIEARLKALGAKIAKSE